MLNMNYLKFSLFLTSVLWFYAFLDINCSYTNGQAYSGLKNSPLSNVSVISGAKAFIPCDTNPPTPSDRPIVMLLYRGAGRTPIYSIDAREGDFDFASQWVDKDILGSRAHLEITTRVSGLVIDPVLEKDQALYRCRVDFKSSPTRNARIQLSVVVLPKKLSITNVTGVPLKGAIGPFLLGEKLTLICEAVGGKPRPSVAWWRGDTMLDDIIDMSRNDMSSNILTLSNISRGDLFTILTCRASNTKLLSPMFASVTLDMSFPPVEIHLTGPSETKVEGDVLTLTCETRGSRPAADITWWRDNEAILDSTTKIYDNGNITKSTLELILRMDDNGMRILCRAKNPVLTLAVLEESRLLHVFYPPRLTLTPGPSIRMEDIKEGKDIYFECSIKSHPKASETKWFLDERELVHNVSAGIIKSNQSLVLQKVRRSFSGKFTCVAENTAGTGISNALHLKIKYKPVCEHHKMKVYGAQKKERITVLCSVESDPPPLAFQWAFNASTEVVDLSWFKGQTGQEVSYIPRSDLDFGSLLCWAKNEVGQQRIPCVMHVIQAGIPDPVSNCTIQNLTTISASIECIPGWSGGIEQSFTLQVLEGGSAVSHSGDTPRVLAKTSTSPQPHFFLTGLQPNTEYMVSLRAINEKGRSQEKHVVITTPEGGRLRHIRIEAKPEEIKLKPVMATALGVAGAFILVGLIFISAIWARKVFLNRRASDPSSTNMTDIKDLSSTEMDHDILQKHSKSGSETVGIPDLVPPRKGAVVSVHPECTVTTNNPYSSNVREIGSSLPTNQETGIIQDLLQRQTTPSCLSTQEFHQNTKMKKNICPPFPPPNEIGNYALPASHTNANTLLANLPPPSSLPVNYLLHGVGCSNPLAQGNIASTRSGSVLVTSPSVGAISQGPIIDTPEEAFQIPPPGEWGMHPVSGRESSL